ncbi:MAG: transcriptional repressor [Rhodobacteraceae bacterium]|nr:transcriptional repressor [Paracoccaceae bacterium]MYF46047.1 transcriptional repressor [Paracoccaceae bacterium]MYI91904.1 transcriptional repressor [Paracoccaceae bacterium]
MHNSDMKQRNIIDQAKLYCLQQKERLTKPRLEVLKIIATSSKPMGAYKILEKLGKVIQSPKPPTAYRAIEFWQKKGFIHRIESLNAYVVCQAGHRHNGGQFLICDDCGTVIETHMSDLTETVNNCVANNTFTPSSWNFEIHGLCDQCQSE